VNRFRACPTAVAKPFNSGSNKTSLTPKLPNANSEIAQRMRISKRTVEDYMTTAFAHLRKFRKEILGVE